MNQQKPAGDTGEKGKDMKTGNTHEAGHTPGPWTIGRAEVTSVLALDGDRRFAVCVVWPNPIAESYAAGMAEKRANTRLIATAPELLAALRECVDFISRAHGGEGMSEAERWALLSDARTDARAAVAKAEGRTT